MPIRNARLQRPAERSRMQGMPVEPFYVEARQQLADEGGHCGPANDRRERLARFLRARFMRAVAARCFHADRHPLHQTLKRRLANRQRLKPSQRNRCCDSRRAVRTPCAGPLRHARGGTRRDGARTRSSRRCGPAPAARRCQRGGRRFAPTARRSSSDSPDCVADKARSVTNRWRPDPTSPKQPGLPQEAVRRPDENHAAVVEHALKQEFAQWQMQQRS